jgi:hypothetical protein
VLTTPDNLWHQRSSDRNLEKDFEHIVEEYKKANMKLDLIMVLFPFKVTNSNQSITHVIMVSVADPDHF